MNPVRGIILFAHGSRDPGWRKPIESVAERVAARDPASQVACAYLELEQPDLPSAAAALVARGVTSLVVVPMFLGVGKHAREDLPVLVQQLRQRHPGIELTLTPAIGEQAEVLELLADVVVRLS